MHTEPYSKFWYFENFNLLEPLSSEDKIQLIRITTMRIIPKGKTIYFSHAQDCVYFLKQGKVKISRYSEEGKEMVVTLLGAGEVFGELAMSNGSGSRFESAIAVEEATICCIGVKDWEWLLSSNSKLSLRVTKYLGQRMLDIQAKLENLIFKSSAERIREFIKEMARDYGKAVAGSKAIEVELNLTHEEIAKLTATNRQKVTTVLGELEKENIISYNRKGIVVKEPDKL